MGYLNIDEALYPGQPDIKYELSVSLDNLSWETLGVISYEQEEIFTFEPIRTSGQPRGGLLLNYRCKTEFNAWQFTPTKNDFISAFHELNRRRWYVRFIQLSEPGVTGEPRLFRTPAPVTVSASYKGKDSQVEIEFETPDETWLYDVAGTFTLSAPALLVDDDATASSVITITRQGSFDATVNFVIVGAPAGLTVSLSSASVSGSMLEVRAVAPYTLGRLSGNIQVRGTALGIERLISIPVSVAGFSTRRILREAATEELRHAGTYSVAEGTYSGLGGTSVYLDVSGVRAYYADRPPRFATLAEWKARKAEIDLRVAVMETAGVLQREDVLNVVGFSLAASAVNWADNYGTRTGVEADWGKGMYRLLSTATEFDFAPDATRFVADDFMGGYGVLNYNPRPSSTLVMPNGQNAAAYHGYLSNIFDSGGGDAVNCMKELSTNDNDSPPAPATDPRTISVCFYVEGTLDIASGENWLFHSINFDGEPATAVYDDNGELKNEFSSVGRLRRFGLVFDARLYNSGVEVSVLWGGVNGDRFGLTNRAISGTGYEPIDGWVRLYSTGEGASEQEGRFDYWAVNDVEPNAPLAPLTNANYPNEQYTLHTTKPSSQDLFRYENVIPLQNKILGSGSLVENGLIIGQGAATLRYKIISFGGGELGGAGNPSRQTHKTMPPIMKLHLQAIGAI